MQQYYPHSSSVYYPTPPRAAATANPATAQPTSQLHLHMQQQQPPPPPPGPLASAFASQPMPHPYSHTPQAGLIAFQNAQLHSAMQQQPSQHPHFSLQQQQQLQQLQQAAGMHPVPYALSQPMIQYSPTAASAPYGYFGASPTAARPGVMSASQPVFSAAPPPQHVQRLYSGTAPMGYPAAPPMPVPSFASPHAAAAQHATTQPLPLSRPPAVATMQPRVAPHVAVAVSPAHTPTHSISSPLGATPTAAFSNPSPTSTAAASIAGSMKPAAAVPALRSAFAAAGQPIPAQHRPQPPTLSTAVPPPLADLSLLTNTLALSPSEHKSYAALSRERSSSKAEKGATRRGVSGAESGGVKFSAADSSSSNLPYARRPQLLHSRSAALPCSSLSRSSLTTPIPHLPRPTLTAQRSLPIVSNAQGRNSIAATERVRISDKLAGYLSSSRLDVEQLLALAACLAEETLYERSESRLDYMKRAVELQHAMPRLSTAAKRLRAAASAASTPAGLERSSEADVTGLLALAQSSSVEQAQGEAGDWGQRKADDDSVDSMEEDDMRKRQRD